MKKDAQPVTRREFLKIAIGTTSAILLAQVGLASSQEPTDQQQSSHPTPAPLPTGTLPTPTLSISASTLTPAVGQAVTFTGLLLDPSGIGMGGQQVFLQQQNLDGTWSNVAWNYTDSLGNYSIQYTFLKQGTFMLRTSFGGTPTPPGGGGGSPPRPV